MLATELFKVGTRLKEMDWIELFTYSNLVRKQSNHNNNNNGSTMASSCEEVDKSV